MALSQPALGRNATPAWGLEPPEPAQRDVLAAARKVDSAHRRADDQRRPPPARPAPARRQSLRRVKDSREQLRSTRARGTSNATTDSTTPSTAPGRSFTVANINNGIIYLRYVCAARERAREDDECGGRGRGRRGGEAGAIRAPSQGPPSKSYRQAGRMQRPGWCFSEPSAPPPQPAYTTHRPTCFCLYIYRPYRCPCSAADHRQTLGTSRPPANSTPAARARLPPDPSRQRHPRVCRPPDER